MTVTETDSELSADNSKASKVDLKFELAVIPVSDVDRAKRFYSALGWRLDIDFAASVELEHPIQSCFIGLAGIVSLLVSICLSTTHRALSLACFCFGIAWTRTFAIYQTGKLCMGASKTETLTPILYLPMVAGAFLSASACAAMGYVDWGVFEY